MRTFQEIFDIAAERKGGSDALKAMLEGPADAKAMADIPNDRFLAQMAQCIFNSGFNWKVVEAKWDGFEAAFQGFDVGRVAMFHDDDMARLVSDERIVRHGGKIKAVIENAQYLIPKIKEHESVGAWLSTWPRDNYVGLLEEMKKNGSRLGGNTGQYFLRFMNYDSFILSADVVGRLVAEGVIDKPPTSKKAMNDVQNAFNIWCEQSGRSLKEVSRVLAMSVG